MAKRITLKDVKHVDLVPVDFLTEIALNPDWNAEDIGCYFILCMHLYCQGGSLKFDCHKLAKMCRTTPKRFVKSWDKIAIKFVKTCPANESSGKKSVFEFESKRVRKELNAARKRMQTAVTSGLKGANKRWGGHSDPNGVAIAKRNETKRNETNKTKLNETNENSPSSDKNLPSFSLRFAEQLDKHIRPFSKSDKMALVNLIHWLRQQTIVGIFNQEIYEVVLGYAKEAKTGRNPMAVFFATLKRELGYRGKNDQGIR